MGNCPQYNSRHKLLGASKEISFHTIIMKRITGNKIISYEVQVCLFDNNPTNTVTHARTSSGTELSDVHKHLIVQIEHDTCPEQCRRHDLSCHYDSTTKGGESPPSYDPPNKLGLVGV